MRGHQAKSAPSPDPQVLVAIAIDGADPHGFGETLFHAKFFYPPVRQTVKKYVLSAQPEAAVAIGEQGCPRMPREVNPRKGLGASVEPKQIEGCQKPDCSVG
jgi:hypothetical protein